MADRPILLTGNKNYSSWSMRAWLALRWAGIDFEDRTIPMQGGVYGKSPVLDIAANSPSGRVPALKIRDLAIWDSLAICEWAAETKPDSGLLPADPKARAVCRSAAAEMHSGLTGIRNALTMNIRRRPKAGEPPRQLPEDAQKDIERLDEMWADARARFNPGGPLLFGKRSLADAFFTPVATRFRTYGVPLSPASKSYCDALLADADYLDWEKAAYAEPWVIEIYENS